MHIKKLEIAGFKSFVDRTVIHFDHDVIGIVGPNGCGKSNIVDSIRWCMGEQSAKHLRGRAMEDVIFNGSESRQPHGLAEVTLTFDNSDPALAETLPPEYRDYSEIAVTRRLFRDGTSEYLINKTSVRLRDVTELFLGTGVGTKAYSIVEQGRIGQIVSARPQDRRLFLEEAAGITKYKQRRKQAERKMELTRQNLLRINDIVSEIDRNRSSLKRQSAKAERFLEYRTELEELLLHDASHRLLEMIVVSRVKRELLDSATTQASEITAQLAERDQALEAARAEASAIEDRSEQASKAAFEADNQVATLQAESDRCRDKLSHLTIRLEAGEGEKTQLELKLADLAAEYTDLAQKVSQLEQDEKTRDADATEEDRVLSELRNAEALAETEVQTRRASISNISASLSTAGARLELTLQRRVDNLAERDQLQEERGQLDLEGSVLEAKKTALVRSVEDLAQGKHVTAEELARLDQELASLRPQVLESERRLDAGKNEFSLKRNRLRALEDMLRRFEGVGNGPRTLLSKNNPLVQGMLADRLDVPAAYTTALAALLGDRLQAIIVGDTDQGLELLGALREENRGRATLLSQHPRFTAGQSRSVIEHDALVIAFLADEVHFAPEDEPLVRALIADTVIVQSARDALEITHRHAGLTAVSLDGTVVHADGSVSGGSGDTVAAAMVEQKREMRELGGEVAKLTEQLADFTKVHTALKDRIAELETSREQARQGAHQREIEHVTAEKDLSRLAAEIERIGNRLEVLANKITKLDQRLESADVEEKECSERIDEHRHALELAQAELVLAEEAAQAQKNRSAAQAGLVTERKVRLAQVREQVEGARAAIERVTALSSELTSRLDRLALDLTEAATSYGESAARLVTLREARATALEVAQAAHQSFDEVRQLLEQIRNALGSHEGELRELRVALAVAQEELRKYEMETQKLDLEREHLIRNVRERFRGLELPKIVGDYHARPAPDAEHHRRIDELTKLIDRMGPVNLDAKTEYEEAEKRFVDLSTQKEDIERALVDLERAIKHMDRESKRRFKETFESVNALFQATFGRMFNGGHAELLLTEADNLLESGIDIIAQPPGKKLANIELMSGGEKALTAASLIFAIFQHKPSPFCILDEVDAPLDEANVARYNEAVRAMTDRSQFILITHVKKTMQSVDVLYGVTMGEPGVSRLVSVKVNEHAATRSDRFPAEVEQQTSTASSQVA